MARASRQTLFVVFLLLLTLVGVGCRADVGVSVSVGEDGSGVVMTEVVLDAEATERLVDLDDATLLLNDLAQTGWDINPPGGTPEGGTVLRAQKTFGTAAQFAEVMNDLSGPEGVFRGFELVRTQTFGRVEYEVRGTVDPTGGFDSFGDEALIIALGRTIDKIATSPPYEAAPQDVTFTVDIELPGEFQQEGSNGAITATPTNTTATWTTDLAARESLALALRSARRSTAAQVLRGVAVVAAVLAALVLFAQILRIFNDRRRRFQDERRREARQAQAAARRAAASGAATGAGATGGGSGPGSGPGPTAGGATGGAAVGSGTGAGSGAAPPDGSGEVDAAESADTAESSPGFRVVALDGPGVLYREGDDIRQLLVPFARQRGSRVTVEDINDKARLLSLGRITSADFWSAIGVIGDPNELDNAYLATHQLNPGVVRYLRSLRDNEIRAACITNESAGWAMKLRSNHSLDGLIDPWVISGSVGVRKPDAPLYEVLRRVTGEAASAILVIDDDLDNLDAARDLGFGTRWFSREGEREDARGHELMRGFEGHGPVDTGPADTGSSPAPSSTVAAATTTGDRAIEPPSPPPGPARDPGE